jgi:ribonucleotide monophosphatase NagD (HAD superfamily)
MIHTLPYLQEVTYMHPIQGLIIDSHGTVFRGDELIEGAHEAINQAHLQGKKIVFFQDQMEMP